MLLPDDLKRVLERADKEPEEENLRAVRTKLHAVTQQVAPEKENVDLRTELVNIWLSNDLQTMKVLDDYHVNLFSVDAVCTLLTHRSTLERVLERYENIQMLAFYSLEIVARKRKSTIDRRNAVVVDIMAACIGQPVIDDASLTLEKATDLLYGNMAYSLYRPDVDFDEQFPSYLLSQNIPVAGASILKNKNVLARISAIMPDLSSN